MSGILGGATKYAVFLVCDTELRLSNPLVTDLLIYKGSAVQSPLDFVSSSFAVKVRGVALPHHVPASRSGFVP